MSDEIAASRTRISVPVKLAYGLGSVAFGIKDHGFSALLMLYYNQVIGLPASWVGAAIMVAMIVDAVVDPLIGHWSDSFRSRWGRRHPFMYASALPLSLAYLLLWSPPSVDQGMQFAYLVVMSILVRISISFFEIPNTALMNEFTKDYDERTSLATYRTMLYAIGMVGMGVVTFKLLLRPDVAGTVGQLNAAGYIGYSHVAAALMLACVMLSSWGSHRHVARVASDIPAQERVGLIGLWRGLGAILLDRVYSSVLLCCFFFAVATGMNTALGTYFNTYFWRMSADQMGTLAAAAFVGMLLAPPTAMLARRFGKKKVAIGLLLVALAACTGPIAIVLVLGLQPSGSRLMGWLIVQSVFSVQCILAGMILLTSMVADVGEHLQLKTGRRMEGLMFAALIMLNKAVSGMGVFTAGLMLSAIHFPEKARPGEVAVPLIHQLGWIYIVSLSVLWLLAVLCLRFYPITREAHLRMVERLENS
ncbi:MFS transporter [Solimonas terrae]|uniref:MFS transporter n=1 Tax=Solimonas terrae TaxID=1396819 RepID=A0A6M2BTC8_9GAMM|nr:MFS transporter [Solimonas terrae]NGY05580.1 hypothetical protein [Solimonas terrae]